MNYSIRHEAYCLECEFNKICGLVCKAQETRAYWRSKTTKELADEIEQNNSNVMNIAIAERLRQQEEEIKRLSSPNKIKTKTLLDFFSQAED